MTDQSPDTHQAVRPLLRVRQIRSFTDEPPTEDQIDAIVDAARWTGSSTNSQPWRFIVIHDLPTLRALGEAGMTQTRPLLSAPAAVAIALPQDQYAITHAYDEGRAAERILIAAGLVGLAGGIAWIRKDVAPVAAEALRLPEGWSVRTIVAVGHPTVAGLARKSKPGEARRPRQEMVFEERWPAG
jgi:nitroreductase